MADQKVTDLTAMVAADLTDDDLFLIVDAATNPPKKMTKAELLKGLIASGTSGDIIYHNGTTWVRLAKGTAEQVLQINAGATAPEWASRTTPGLEFISSTDFANDATGEFTGFDATKYDFYGFCLQNVTPATDAVFFYGRTSTDGGSTYDSGASDYLEASTGYDNILLYSTTQTYGSAAGEQGASGWIWVFGPHLAKKTSVILDFGYFSADGAYRTVTRGFVRDAGADVDGFQFRFASGNIESGTITMYGGRNA